MDENEQKEPMTEPAEAAEQTQEEIKKEEPKQADTKQEDEKKLTESLRVRKIGYMKQQVERQRAAEDLLTEQIMEEQRILDETLGEIDDQIACTEKSRKYNREMQEELNARVYGMHGISGDKIQGMQESKSAYYRGCAFSLFFLSVVLTLLCGFLHGFSADVTLFMLCYTAIEGALLAKDEKRSRWLAFLCRVLYLLMFPAMMVLFVCYELGYPEYGQFLPFMTAGGIVIVILAVASVFLYDPYRKDKKRLRTARNYMSDIEKLARKEINKNRKIRDREEKKEQKAAEKREQKEQKKKLREKRREERKQKWEERKNRKQEP